MPPKTGRAPSTAHWSLISVYYQILRDGVLDLSRSAFYKYARLFGAERKGPGKRDKRKKKGLRASRPFEILHMDVSVFRPDDHTKVFIYLVIDNFSRAILSWRASLEYKAGISLENLKEALSRAGPLGYERDKSLIVDDGSENKAEVENFVQQEEALRKLIAQKEISFSNSMVERVFQKLKHEGLYHRMVGNYEQTLSVLEEETTDYMTRPHGQMKGLTPKEVLEGAVPKSHIPRGC